MLVNCRGCCGGYYDGCRLTVVDDVVDTMVNTMMDAVVDTG